MSLIKTKQVIIVAEGTFKYYSEKQVKDLFHKIQQNFTADFRKHVRINPKQYLLKLQ